MSELTKSLLNHIWQQLLTDGEISPDQTLKIEDQIILQNDYCLALPSLFLARQYGIYNEILSCIYLTEDIGEAYFDRYWRLLVKQKTLVDLGKQGYTYSNPCTKEEYIKQSRITGNIVPDEVVITVPIVRHLQ